MKSRRTAKQWQQLINCRKEFEGTNVEFCRHHGISMTSFYKHQANLNAKVTTGFVQVKTTTEQTHFEAQGDIEFNVHSGKLTLTQALPAEQVVAIIKGLSQ